MQTASRKTLIPSWAVAVVGAAFLASCGDRDVILPGERLDIRSGATIGDATGSVDTGTAVAFAAPPPVATPDWTHRAGNPNHSVPHAAFSATPSRIWSADIGQGNSRKHRITADPVVAAGRVFTIDSRSRLTATSVEGARLWSASLVPDSDKDGDASGGGLAVEGNTVYATTGFGTVHAFDANSGDEQWVQRLDAPATASPTVAGGLVYVISRDNIAWAIDARNGRVRWNIQGTPSVSGMIGGAGPAISGDMAIFPFASGEIVAALRQGGVRQWGATVSGGRKGRAYANVTDIVADPVVANGVLYTGNQSGRAVAIDMDTGTRLWTADDGAYGPVWVSGDSVFLVTDEAELVRLSAENGAPIWTKELPYFTRNRVTKRKAIYAHFGPVLAGGNLWVASDRGELTAYDPQSGDVRQVLDVPGGAASNLAVANGTMYVVSENGTLHAYR